jgi:hypothetical protein
MPYHLAWTTAITALLCGAATAQRKVLRHDAAAYVCTEEGTNWTYLRTTSPGGVLAAKAIVSVGVFGTYRRTDGSRWHLVGRRAGERAVIFEHWNTEGPGLLVEKGFAADRVPAAATCLLAAPVGAVNTWEWSKDKKAGPIQVRAAVLSFDEPVTVPAGTFRAVHVQIAELDDDVVKSDLWFARDTGLVRSLRQDKDGTEETELQTFARGRDQASDRLSTVQMLAPPDWLWSKHGTAAITWFEKSPGSVMFDGRFAIVDNGDARHCAFVAAGRFLPVSTAAIDWLQIQQGGQEHDTEQLMRTSALLYVAEHRLFAPQIDLEGAHGSGTMQARDTSGLRRFNLATDRQNFSLVTVTESKD